MQALQLSGGLMAQLLQLLLQQPLAEERIQAKVPRTMRVLLCDCDCATSDEVRVQGRTTQQHAAEDT